MTKEEIKAWLKSEGRNYQWLADQLNVAKQTVAGWLSTGKNIPKPQQASILRLMRGSAAMPFESIDEMLATKAAAEKAGLTIEQFMRKALEEKCKKEGIPWPLIIMIGLLLFCFAAASNSGTDDTDTDYAIPYHGEPVEYQDDRWEETERRGW